MDLRRGGARKLSLHSQDAARALLCGSGAEAVASGGREGPQAAAATAAALTFWAGCSAVAAASWCRPTSCPTASPPRAQQEPPQARHRAAPATAALPARALPTSAAAVCNAMSVIQAQMRAVPQSGTPPWPRLREQNRLARAGVRGAGVKLFCSRCRAQIAAYPASCMIRSSPLTHASRALRRWAAPATYCAQRGDCSYTGFKQATCAQHWVTNIPTSQCKRCAHCEAPAAAPKPLLPPHPRRCSAPAATPPPRCSVVCEPRLAQHLHKLVLVVVWHRCGRAWGQAV